MHSHEHDNQSAHNNITPARLEAFSDAVIAIIITIMVLELHVPAGDTFSALADIIPPFVAYVISFIIVGIYWNNHHHLLRVVHHVSTGIMWANLNLLFWLSLIPFGSGWIGENHGGNAPTVFYSAVLLLCAFSYSILQMQVIKHSDKRDELYRELNRSPKGLISIIFYTFAMLAAFFNPVISDIFIVLVSLIWFVPDRRIEKYL